MRDTFDYNRAPGADTWPPCDGTDRHLLGLSPTARVFFLAAALVLNAALLVFDVLGQFIVIGLGALLGALLVAGIATSLDGGALVANRFGFRRFWPLLSVARVQRYSYRGAVSLHFWDAAGHRAGSVPVDGFRNRLPLAAAYHLRRYLDRPAVVWGP